MNVRAVAVRGVPQSRLRVVTREITPSNATRRSGGITVGSGFRARLADDRQLIPLKALMLAVLVVLAMALEVPW